MFSREMISARADFRQATAMRTMKRLNAGMEPGFVLIADGRLSEDAQLPPLTETVAAIEQQQREAEAHHPRRVVNLRLRHAGDHAVAAKKL